MPFQSQHAHEAIRFPSQREAGASKLNCFALQGFHLMCLLASKAGKFT